MARNRDLNNIQRCRSGAGVRIYCSSHVYRFKWLRRAGYRDLAARVDSNLRHAFFLGVMSKIGEGIILSNSKT